MSGVSINVLLVLATVIVGLFCAGFAAAQVLTPQAVLERVLP